MSQRLPIVVLCCLFLAIPSFATEKLFFEVGPRYSVSIGPHPLADYWGDGWGLGGSMGYSFNENLSLIGGVSYRNFGFSGEAPFPEVIQ